MVSTTTRSDISVEAYYIKGLTVFSKIPGMLRAGKHSLVFTSNDNKTLFELSYPSIHGVHKLKNDGWKIKTSQGNYLVFFYNYSRITSSTINARSAELLTEGLKRAKIMEDVLNQHAINISGHESSELSYKKQQKYFIYSRRIGALIAAIFTCIYLIKTFS